MKKEKKEEKKKYSCWVSVKYHQVISRFCIPNTNRLIKASRNNLCTIRRIRKAEHLFVHFNLIWYLISWFFLIFPLTIWACPASLINSDPDSESQIRIVLSWLLDAILSPSGENETHRPLFTVSMKVLHKKIK